MHSLASASSLKKRISLPKPLYFFRPFATYYLLIWMIIKLLARFVFRDYDYPDLVLTIKNRYLNIRLRSLNRVFCWAECFCLGHLLSSMSALI